MSQLVRDRNFVVGSEGTQRITADIVVVRFSLDQEAPFLLEGTDQRVRRTVTCISRANNENVLSKQATKSQFGYEMLELKRSV